MSTGIAFSGGGLKAVAHLGVWQVLLENRIPVQMVAGTSAGSIVASALALGITPDQLLQEVKKIKPRDVYDLPWWVFLLWHIYQFLPKNKPPSKSLISLPRGLIAGNKLEKWLTIVFGRLTMDQIKFPLAITATDINTAQLIVFVSDGLVNNTLPSLPRVSFIQGATLAEAIRASTAIPGVFAPKIINNRVLVDGGVSNNLPADILKFLGCDEILGIDLGQQANLSKPVKNVIDITIKSLEILVQSTSQVTSTAYCNLTLTPSTGSIPLWDLAAIDGAFTAGVSAAMAALPEIKQIFI